MADRGDAVSGARGESVLNVDGREVRILFTNRALASVEAATRKSIVSLMQGMVAGTSGIYEVACMLQAGIQAARNEAKSGGRAVTLEDAYNVMDSVGFVNALEACSQAASAVFSYKPSIETEASPNE